MYHCPHCTQPLDAPDLAGQVVACPACGERFTMPGAPPVMVATEPRSSVTVRRYKRAKSGPSRGMAAVLSLLLPGLGQLFLGRHLAAIAFLIAAVVSAFAAVEFWPLAAASLFVWIWAVVDALWN